jgi:hypothetical protein
MKLLIYNEACECLLPLTTVTVIVIALCIKCLLKNKVMIYVVTVALYSYGDGEMDKVILCVRQYKNL